VEAVFTRDELLTWVSAYWFGNCIGSSFAPYAAGGSKPWQRVVAPTASTIFPKHLVNAPPEFAERFFNVERWEEMPSGGHFAAWEQPDQYTTEIRAALILSSD